jgi:[protein-PII] uridylyltransferase
VSAEVAREPHPVLAGDLARLRWERSDRVDGRLTELFAAALQQVPAADGRSSLVAVGGYGRGEMSPHSDVDVVLLHAPELPAAVVAALAELVWYPLWNDAVPLDHAVRDTATMRSVANRDWRAALGMLDARHVAGEHSMTADLRSAVLADWRRGARKRLPELRQACADRAARAGELAYAAVPDLKESRGGLRDGVVLRALVATWLVDVPHQQVEEQRAALLDVRDALHVATGRRGDRLPPELIADVAAVMGADPDRLGRDVRRLGRRTAHLTDLTWRRVEQALVRPSRLPGRRSRRPQLERLGDGISGLAGEVVLDHTARPSDDPYLSITAAAVAAERGLLLAPATAARLAEVAPETLPAPWPEHARRALVRLLAAGPGLVPVWEELDHAGLVERWLPEWDAVRLRPSESAVHRFTVDRHCVETCVEASARLRSVGRPDLLVVAALLHDLGKGVGGDHSRSGAPLAASICERLGFDAGDAQTVRFLVAQHLLLPTTATRRDLDDPDSVAAVADVVGDHGRLALLATLTECDARAAGPMAWTAWRAGLVTALVGAIDATLVRGRPHSAAGLPLQRGGLSPLPSWARTANADRYVLLAEPHADGSRICVAARDRSGLLADVAATLAIAGLVVRAARAAVHDGVAAVWWDVDAIEVDVPRLRLRLHRVLDGSVDVAARLESGAGSTAGQPTPRAAQVQVLPGVSASATVVEIRADDRPGVLWRVFRVLADAGVDVRSAHMESIGPQVNDVVYVTDAQRRPLPDARAHQLCDALAAALGPAR